MVTSLIFNTDAVVFTIRYKSRITDTHKTAQRVDTLTMWTAIKNWNETLVNICMY